MTKEWFVSEEIPRANWIMLYSPIVFFVRGFKQLDSPSPKYCLCDLREGTYRLMFETKDFERTGREIFEKILEEPEWKQEVHEKLEKACNEFMDESRKLLKTNMEELSDEEIADIYNKWYKKKEKAHGFGLPGFVLEYKHEHFSSYLKEYLKEKIKEKNLDIKSGDVFGILSTPLRRTFAKQEELRLLEIAIRIKNNPFITEILRHENTDNTGKIKEKIKNANPKIFSSIKEHYEEYRWLPYMYEGPAWELDYFISVIAGIIKGDDPVELYDEVKSEPEETEKEQKELIKKLGIDEEHKKLFEIARELIYYKALRKDSIYFGFYAVESLLKEVSKRHSIELNYLRSFIEEEMEESLRKGQFPKEKLKERFDYSLVYVDNENIKLKQGNEAEEFIEKADIKEEEIEDSSEIKGSSAYGGLVKGRVRIINNPDELGKIEKGEIMVSHQTNPDLVPAMKKAGAIVTETGGITSHAAIVSRELKVPCVVGTNIATKVLKDGDLVEVDATEGIVKKLS